MERRWATARGNSQTPRCASSSIPSQARSGPPLGTLFAAFAAHTTPRADEAEALTMAAELATLAIETSRLHSDLVHRSEFDLLTDVQNRFAMEKTLDAMIRRRAQSAGIFAMVYIDLNDSSW